MHVDAVLRQLSVAEVQKLLDATRREKEAKEKEMQAMGGSRYHDLIESADQIVSMHEASMHLEHALGDMPRLWKQLETCVDAIVERQPTEASAPISVGEDPLEEDDVHVIVAASERMWAAMERGRPLEAYATYHQVQAAHERLSPEMLHDKAFLALDLQAMHDFPKRIEECAHACLAVPKQRVSFYADALRTLEQMAPQQSRLALLTTFLSGRTKAVEATVARESSPQSIVLRLLHIVLSSLSHVDALFLDSTSTVRLLPADDGSTEKALATAASSWLRSAIETLRHHILALLEMSRDVTTLGNIQSRLQRCVDKYTVPLPLLRDAMAVTKTNEDDESSVWTLLADDLFVRKTQALFQGALDDAGSTFRHTLLHVPSEASVQAFVDALSAMLAQADGSLHAVLHEGMLRLLFDLVGFLETRVAASIAIVELCLTLQMSLQALFASVSSSPSSSLASLSEASIRAAVAPHATDGNVPAASLASIFSTLALDQHPPSPLLSALLPPDYGATLTQVVFLCHVQQRHGPSTLVTAVFEVLANEVGSVWAHRAVADATQPVVAALRDQFYGYSNEDWRRVHQPFWVSVAVPTDDDDDDETAGGLGHVWLPWSETPAIAHALFTLQASMPRCTQPAVDTILKAQLRSHVLGWTFDVLASRVASLAAAKPPKPPLDFGQAVALQSIFDVYFVRLCIGDADFARFGWGDAIAHAGLQALVTDLVHDWIDPVDWELYGPPLVENVVAQFQTSRLLLSGLATSSVVSGAKVLPRESPLLDMAPPAPRFALLPVPSLKPAPRLPTPVHVRPPSPKVPQQRSSIQSLLSTSGSSLLGSAAAAKGISLLSTYLQPTKE
ncbi:hypothetical protein SPRG_07496 [Saprolegnia parasitica CBS 223.65]|uniref:Conserved oligomeric Golgi complex subunit 1 n=1 Tax=Saprolegnia parasitica (strain CBS 223.65) TaxID=695850 RepID=A0A067CKE5_SAPPC|nr:hypothetical protein SPRG_07496 [Saprolegnia parasitica CBS 223.65]KDO27247.1 hypothetical protein SPRG_07496 [Saprolegnia parasitica CBS 223.65]|eukprot:XP_012202024.1 hypothetical protein SPRG_07496 [Saprolegnia parasitica CBS 223.65]